MIQFFRYQGQTYLVDIQEEKAYFIFQYLIKKELSRKIVFQAYFYIDVIVNFFRNRH